MNANTKNTLRRIRSTGLAAALLAFAWSFDATAAGPGAETVSYTHLTLPTNREV